MVTTESVDAIARARPNGIPAINGLATGTTMVGHGKPGLGKEMTVAPVEPRVPAASDINTRGSHSAG